MGLSSVIKSSRVQNDFVFSSAPAFYTAAAHVICSVTGGPVWVKLVVEYCDTAMTNATTTTITGPGGAAMDAGAVAINAGGLGAIVVSPLHNGAKNASALADQWPDATGVATQAGFGMVWGLGDVTVTFATVMATTDRYSLHIVYQKLSPASLIS